MQNYFLGGNTCRGFYSFYDGFCAEKDDFLYIIKGGPGCGKSSLMKRVAQKWEQSGFAVERIFCSGDPDSLDGIYCPALHLGYADGTAPHRLDVRYMGVNGAYLDFSPFFRLDTLRQSREQIRTLADACSQEYQKAYTLLGTFAEPAQNSVKRASCFFRAVTCRGLISFYPADVQTVSEKELRLLLDAPCRVIAHPLFPDRIEGVFLKNTQAVAFCRNEKAEDALLNAVSAVCPILSKAKSLHDELESLYRPHIDFARVDRLVKKHEQMQK